MAVASVQKRRPSRSPSHNSRRPAHEDKQRKSLHLPVPTPVQVAQVRGHVAVVKLSEKWSWFKYLVLPMTWALTSYCGRAHMMPTLMGGTALRYIVAFVMTFLSKLDCVAEPVRVRRQNPPARQHERELDWDGPVILSPLAFLLVDLLTPWLQESRVVPFSLQSLAWCAFGHYMVTEPIYYVFHRWLHTPRIYHSSHFHHHASTTTEAISGTSHPLGNPLVA